MDQTASPRDLERRKLVKLRLRRDIEIKPQKYEGRTYYVVKDPVSLRYYRLKDNEHYLLQFMDGAHTLEDAQKAYEKFYRPDRLKLEDLEGFGQQLLTAGLAQNESPLAGKQLFDRRKKRKRTEWMQTFTNILYIKIPVIDPDRLLQGMLRWLGWIFTMSFFLLSVGVMLGAVMLVATHFDTFRNKLPDYHEFFSFKTVVYLWVALGCVKVIHEFGHGLSCKVFGGEVHEMGALFLCFSPALYCNVSDAWVLPNKWHRIIISAAGIYVELIIAAIATFVWWNTPTQPFINNLSLSLMVVCSVSTVVFNANPLMRYDGYYVLADWLEIPNLRERSNRFLSNLVQEHCLGIEVQPEPYMALWRRILFVVYAIASYIYKWVVTFSILWFMYSFLRPYKLEVISSMLALASLGSLLGWPTYRLCKNIYRRGRLPDMKRWRVMVTGSVLAALLLFVFLVPVPVSRVRGQALVQPSPETSSTVHVKHKGKLVKLNVRDGDRVNEGDVLAEFQNRDLDIKIADAQTKIATQTARFDAANKNKSGSSTDTEKAQWDWEKTQAIGERDTAEAERAVYRRIEKDLILLAPQSGIVAGAPQQAEIGRWFDVDPSRPFLTIYEPGKYRVCLPVVTAEFNRLKEDVQRSSDAANKTRRHLRDKVSVNYDKTPLDEVFKDLRKQVKGVQLFLEIGLKVDVPVTFQAHQQPLAEVLDKMFKELGLGYILVSNETSDHDGWLKVRPGTERGVPDGPIQFAELDVSIRVQGRGTQVWKGKLSHLPESEAREIPPALSSRAGGPVAVKAGGRPGAPLVPQAQHFLVYIDLVEPDAAIAPGTMANVKVHCKPETCARWLWRKINDVFDLGLI
jgi:putative peptide zinc metalloprotease protein